MKTPLFALQEAIARHRIPLRESYQFSYQVPNRAGDAESWWASLTPEQRKKVWEKTSLSGIPSFPDVAHGPFKDVAYKVWSIYAELLAPPAGHLQTDLDTRVEAWWNGMSKDERKKTMKKTFGDHKYSGFPLQDHAKNFAGILQSNKSVGKAPNGHFMTAADVVRELYLKIHGG